MKLVLLSTILVLYHETLANTQDTASTAWEGKSGPRDLQDVDICRILLNQEGAMPGCMCIPEGGGFDVLCSDFCQQCLPVGADVCILYSLETQYEFTSSGQLEIVSVRTIEEQSGKDSSNKVLTIYENYSGGNMTACEGLVNDEMCSSCTTSEATSACRRGGLILNCTNLDGITDLFDRCERNKAVPLESVFIGQNLELFNIDLCVATANPASIPLSSLPPSTTPSLTPTAPQTEILGPSQTAQPLSDPTIQPSVPRPSPAIPPSLPLSLSPVPLIPPKKDPPLDDPQDASKTFTEPERGNLNRRQLQRGPRGQLRDSPEKRWGWF
jgi:hypothetical protein